MHVAPGWKFPHHSDNSNIQVSPSQSSHPFLRSSILEQQFQFQMNSSLQLNCLLGFAVYFIFHLVFIADEVQRRISQFYSNKKNKNLD